MIARKHSLNLGITLRDDMGIDDLMKINGLNQNILFFYDLLTLIGHRPCLFIGNVDQPSTITNGKKSYNIMSLQQALSGEQDFDIVFEIGTSLGQDTRSIFREKGKTKIVSVRYGHSMYMDMEQMCYGETMTPGIHINNPEMLWASPHFETAFGYLATLYNSPVRMSPYIWEPDLVDQRFANKDYKKNPSIYVMEPNISFLKNALIPMAIIEQVYRHEPDIFDQANIQCGMEFFDNKYFLENIVPAMPCFNSNSRKGFFNPRQIFEDVFSARDILLGHQHECELNYLYMEALYKGVPLVHNSPALEGVGFYYSENDVYAGREKVLEAIADEDVDGNQKKNDAFIHKYSIHNEAVQMEYASLIEEVMDL